MKLLPGQPRGGLNAGVLFCAGLLALSLLSCSVPPRQPVGQNTKVGVALAKQTYYFLPRDVTFRPTLDTHTMPAGKYEPWREDEDGVYFQAPRSIVVTESGRRKLYKGGIFVHRNQPKILYEYVILRDPPSYYRLPSDFPAELVYNRQ